MININMHAPHVGFHCCFKGAAAFARTVARVNEDANFQGKDKDPSTAACCICHKLSRYQAYTNLLRLQLLNLDA